MRYRTVIAAAALALGIAGLASPAAEAADFPWKKPGQQVRHWTGTYSGYTDGRRARLVIEHDATTERVHSFEITLEDLDRDATFRGTGITHFHPGSPPAHTMQIDQLDRVDGNGRKRINWLLLHTWDTDHISGTSRWNGKDFGMTFSAK